MIVHFFQEIALKIVRRWQRRLRFRRLWQDLQSLGSPRDQYRYSDCRKTTLATARTIPRHWLSMTMIFNGSL